MSSSATSHQPARKTASESSRAAERRPAPGRRRPGRARRVAVRCCASSSTAVLTRPPPGPAPRRPPRAARASAARQQALAGAIGLLQVRIAREDELADAERVVLLDAVGDLGVAADERRARAAAHEADARPQVGGDLELVRPPLVQRDHPALALRLRGGEPRLGARDVRGSRPASSRSASAHASSDVSRVMTCRRMPKRSSRPAPAAAARTRSSFAATCAGGSPQVR